MWMPTWIRALWPIHMLRYLCSAFYNTYLAAVDPCNTYQDPCGPSTPATAKCSNVDRKLGTRVCTCLPGFNSTMNNTEIVGDTPFIPCNGTLTKISTGMILSVIDPCKLPGCIASSGFSGKCILTAAKKRICTCEAGYYIFGHGYQVKFLEMPDSSAFPGCIGMTVYSS